MESCGFKEKDKNNIDKILDYEKSRKVKLALDIRHVGLNSIKKE